MATFLFNAFASSRYAIVCQVHFPVYLLGLNANSEFLKPPKKPTMGSWPQGEVNPEPNFTIQPHFVANAQTCHLGPQKLALLSNVRTLSILFSSP